MQKVKQNNKKETATQHNKKTKKIEKNRLVAEAFYFIFPQVGVLMI
jgi:hypothetical protein